MRALPARRSAAAGTASKSAGELYAVYADGSGKVLDLPWLAPAVDGGVVRRGRPEDFIALPPGTLLLVLPGRRPIAFEGAAQVAYEPADGTQACAVGAALPLGYTRTLLPAYSEQPNAPTLPLYGYAAVAWSAAGLRVAAVATDDLAQWRSDAHGEAEVRRAIARRTRELADTPLLRQLTRCALDYGCYTAQNSFLGRGEAAIPVSASCNARCIGCISAQQPDAGIESAHQRLSAVPAPEEIASFAVGHLTAGKNSIVSFGQGCEGEPLLAAPRIAAAIALIRERTARGTIHCNTNGSRPKALAMLLDAGLESVRVSINSARADRYTAYYRPRGYRFQDVVNSLEVAQNYGAAISLNLLTHPGVTDDPPEMEALAALLRKRRISMVQTRTLNIDPARYFSAVGRPQSQPVGMRDWLAWMHREFPAVRIGNFTRGFG